MDFRLPPNVWSDQEKTFLEKRRKGRLRCKLMVCELGQITNMSASGIRVACDEKPTCKVGEKIDLTLQTQSEKLAVHAKIEWIRKDEKNRYQVGAEFIEVTPQLAFDLVNLARTSMS